MKSLLTLIVLVIIVVGGYFAYYVMAASNPADPIGTKLLSYAPASVKTWACDGLAKRFPTQLPPDCPAPATPAAPTTTTTP